MLFRLAKFHFSPVPFFKLTTFGCFAVAEKVEFNFFWTSLTYRPELGHHPEKTDTPKYGMGMTRRTLAA